MGGGGQKAIATAGKGAAGRPPCQRQEGAAGETVTGLAARYIERAIGGVGREAAPTGQESHRRGAHR